MAENEFSIATADSVLVPYRVAEILRENVPTWGGGISAFHPDGKLYIAQSPDGVMPSMIIYGQDGPQTEALSGVLAKHDILDLSAIPGQFFADDIQVTTITCNSPEIAGDSEIEARVFDQSGALYCEATPVPVAGGVATAQFKTPYPGIYVVEFKRLNAAPTGYIEIEAIAI